MSATSMAQLFTVLCGSFVVVSLLFAFHWKTSASSPVSAMRDRDRLVSLYLSSQFRLDANAWMSVAMGMKLSISNEKEWWWSLVWCTVYTAGSCVSLLIPVTLEK